MNEENDLYIEVDDNGWMYISNGKRGIRIYPDDLPTLRAALERAEGLVPGPVPGNFYLAWQHSRHPEGEAPAR